MKVNVYCVYDGQVKVYAQPFCCRNHAEAIRGFTQAVNSASHPFNAFPADYTVFWIGTFDEDKGVFVALPANERISNGLDVFVPSNQMDLYKDEGE